MNLIIILCILNDNIPTILIWIIKSHLYAIHSNYYRIQWSEYIRSIYTEDHSAEQRKQTCTQCIFIVVARWFIVVGCVLYICCENIPLILLYEQCAVISRWISGAYTVQIVHFFVIKMRRKLTVNLLIYGRKSHFQIVKNKTEY